MAEGFFYPVRALVDKQSFEQGKQELQKLAAASKSIIGGVAGIGAALVGVATGAGVVAQQELKMANAIGVSTEAMTSFKVACGMAGVSSQGLLGSLQQLESKMQKLKIGSVDSGLAKNLGMLGIGYQDFAAMSSEQRMGAVFSAAGKMQDQRLAAEMVGDVLGSAGKDYYQSLQLSGKSLGQQLAEARKLNFVSSQNRKDAAAFMSEVNGIKEAGKSITMLLGSEIASKLTPLAQQIKRYLMTNRQNIIQGIQGVAESIGVVAKGIAGAIEHIAPIVGNLIDKFGGLDTVIIRVGIAFTSLKLAQIGSSIMGLIKNINLLKGGLSGLTQGLGVTALFLILDDLAVWQRGGKSMIGWLIEHADELKDKFKNLIGEANYDNIVKSFEKLKTALEGLKKVLPDIEKLWKSAFLDIFDKLEKGLADLVSYIKDSIEWAKGLIDAFNKGGLSGALTYHKAYEAEKKSEKEGEIYERYKQNLAKKGYETDANLTAEERRKIWEQSIKELKEENSFMKKAFGIRADFINFAIDNAALAKKGLLGWSEKETRERKEEAQVKLNTASEETKAAVIERRATKAAVEAVEQVAGLSDVEKAKAGAQAASEKRAEEQEKIEKRNKSAGELIKDGLKGVWGKITGKVQDGIIAPDGRVIGISPNDWVFALKDLDKLSSAIMPPSMSNQSVNAPASYIINQTFNVSGNVRPEVIKENAYTGTSQALQNSLQNATRIMQFMPGTR